MGDFKKLKVWGKSKDLAIEIYKITLEGGLNKDFGLRDQMRRAAVSVPSNIAEGDELKTNKQSIRHFYIAKGSLAELITQLIIANEIGYLDNEKLSGLLSEAKKISSMLYRLIEVRTLDPRP